MNTYISQKSSSKHHILRETKKDFVRTKKPKQNNKAK